MSSQMLRRNYQLPHTSLPPLPSHGFMFPKTVDPLYGRTQPPHAARCSGLFNWNGKEAQHLTKATARGCAKNIISAR